MEGLLSTVSNTQKAFNTVATNTGSAIATLATNTQTAATNLFKNIPVINSMNLVRPANNTFNSLFQNIGTSAKNTIESVGEKASSVVNTLASPVTSGGIPQPLLFFIGFVILFLIVFSIYSREIKKGWDTLVKEFKKIWKSGQPKQPSEFTGPADVTQNIIEPPKPPVERIVESVLPVKGMGGDKQVFNVESNKYTYYDAEPLCQALGAELATYNQVKEAWDKGADWCNYGWVKGQMAIYPTQQATYDKLQRGPAEERAACGTAGINGGYFDNPEMKFGVNCFGKKPPQDEDMAAKISQGGTIPKTAEYLKFDQKVAEFKTDPETDDVLPFNNDKWSQV